MPTNQNGGPAARSTSNHLIPIGNLNSRDFAPYGQVIANPVHESDTQLKKVSANQGTATKWLDVTNMDNWYSLAASKEPAKVVVNMFVCSPRKLEKREGRKAFPVKILERHPYTPQTFVPLGVTSKDESMRYLVIVAPTLQVTSNTAGGTDHSNTSSVHVLKEDLKDLKQKLPATQSMQPSASTEKRSEGSRSQSLKQLKNDVKHLKEKLPDEESNPAAHANGLVKPKGPGEPDLDHIQAFIARGDQAVTYGPGTWHAPMVVLGDKDIEFVVVQYANGVGVDDCQEFDVQGDVAVGVDEDGVVASAPGIMRAKI